MMTPLRHVRRMKHHSSNKLEVIVLNIAYFTIFQKGGMTRFFPACIVLVLFSCVYHDLSTEPPLLQPVCDPSTTSWQEDILPIMISACATTGCHDGITRKDWTKYDEAKLYAASIKKRTQDKSMPFDGPLPQDQIDLIVCWVDSGAPDN
jgi:hypothetical protein